MIVPILMISSSPTLVVLGAGARGEQIFNVVQEYTVHVGIDSGYHAMAYTGSGGRELWSGVQESGVISSG